MSKQYSKNIDDLHEPLNTLAKSCVNTLGKGCIWYLRIDMQFFGNTEMSIRLHGITFTVTTDRSDIVIRNKTWPCLPSLDFPPALGRVLNADKPISGEMCIQYMTDAIENWDRDKWTRFRRQLRWIDLQPVRRLDA